MMIWQRPTQVRGIALLIVLATLILAVSASATLWQLAATVKLQRQFDQRTEQSDDLLVAVEAPILDWLKSKSASVVLPPEAASPTVEILRDQLIAGKEMIVLRIDAFDQCGMAPIELARSGSPIRLALPHSIIGALDKIALKPNQKPGLDLFRKRLATPTGEPRLFPRVADGECAHYGAKLMPETERSGQHVTGPVESSPSIGSSIATHNPGLINVNTAPIDLVNAAMRAAGKAGLEQVIQARSEGKLASAPSNDASKTGPDTPGLQLASVSTAWSFRIDIEVGPLRRSWWAVYVRKGSQWECVQRLAIPD